MSFRKFPLAALTAGILALAASVPAAACCRNCRREAATSGRVISEGTGSVDRGNLISMMFSVSKANRLPQQPVFDQSSP